MAFFCRSPSRGPPAACSPGQGVISRVILLALGAEAWLSRGRQVGPQAPRLFIQRFSIMGKVGIGLNLEAIRTSHKSFEWGVEFAADLGYEYIEPMVHWGRELLSEARYFHSVSMLDDPFRIRDKVEKHGLKLSAFSSHSQASDRKSVV